MSYSIDETRLKRFNHRGNIIITVQMLILSGLCILGIVNHTENVLIFVICSQLVMVWVFINLVSFYPIRFDGDWHVDITDTHVNIYLDGTVIMFTIDSIRAIRLLSGYLTLLGDYTVINQDGTIWDSSDRIVIPPIFENWEEIVDTFKVRNLWWFMKSRETYKGGTCN